MVYGHQLRAAYGCTITCSMHMQQPSSECARARRRERRARRRRRGRGLLRLLTVAVLGPPMCYGVGTAGVCEAWSEEATYSPAPALQRGEGGATCYIKSRESTRASIEQLARWPGSC